jgi:hypothetical protein
MKFSTTCFLASVLAYSGSLIAQDAQQNPPPPPAVVLATPDYKFEASFKALILQPFANNVDYAAEALPFNYGDAQPAISPSWVIQEIPSDFHFGFDVGIGGIFHGAKSSLKLNWERYHTEKDSNSKTVSSTNNMIGPFFEIGPDASSYKKSKGSTKYHFDEVNLTYGTFINFGKSLHTNLFVGVSFARIEQHRFTQFSDMAETIVRTISVPAKFTGAGPQLGVDFTYKIAKGFQFVGNTKASLYVGPFKNHTKFTTASHDLVVLGDQSPNNQTTSVHNKTGIVPGFEGNLGLAYEFLFAKHYMVKLEAGYQAQLYINAIRSVDMGSEVALGDAGSVGSSTTGVYARTFERTVSDFGMAGPYVTLDVGF